MPRMRKPTTKRFPKDYHPDYQDLAIFALKRNGCGTGVGNFLQLSYMYGIRHALAQVSPTDRLWVANRLGVSLPEPTYRAVSSNFKGFTDEEWSAVCKQLWKAGIKSL